MPKKKRTKSDLASSESPAVTRLSAPSQHASPTDEPRRQSRRKKKAEQKQSKIAAEEVNSVISPITSGNSKSISQSPVGVTAASVVSATTNRRSSVSPKTSKVARNMLQGGAVAESSAKDGDRAILPTKKKRGTAAVDAVGTAPKPAVIPSPAAATKTRADKIASPKAERPSKRKANITSAANGQTTANEPGTLSSPKKLETENAAVTAATTPKPATIQSPTLTTPPTKKSRKSKARRKSKSGETPDAGADVPSVTKFAMNGTSPNDAQASSEKKSMEHAKVGSREKYGRVEDGGATATKKARKHSKAKVAVPDSIATQTSPALTVVLKQSPLRPNGKPSLSPRTQAKVPGEFGVQQDEDNRGGQKPQTGGAPAAGSGSKPSAQGGGHAKPKRVGDGGGESKRKVASESLASPKTKKMKVQDVVSSLVFACVECGGVSGSICACSKCDRVFHLQCLKPRRKRRPPVDWACDNCTGKSMSIVYDQPFCDECGLDANPKSDGVLCSACRCTYHMACLDPPLKARPKGASLKNGAVHDWICLYCQCAPLAMPASLDDPELLASADWSEGFIPPTKEHLDIFWKKAHELAAIECTEYMEKRKRDQEAKDDEIAIEAVMQRATQVLDGQDAEQTAARQALGNHIIGDLMSQVQAVVGSFALENKSLRARLRTMEVENESLRELLVAPRVRAGSSFSKEKAGKSVKSIAAKAGEANDASSRVESAAGALQREAKPDGNKKELGASSSAVKKTKTRTKAVKAKNDATSAEGTSQPKGAGNSVGGEVQAAATVSSPLKTSKGKKLVMKAAAAKPSPVPQRKTQVRQEKAEGKRKKGKFPEPSAPLATSDMDEGASTSEETPSEGEPVVVTQLEGEGETEDEDSTQEAAEFPVGLTQVEQKQHNDNDEEEDDDDDDDDDEEEDETEEEDPPTATGKVSDGEEDDEESSSEEQSSEEDA